MASFLGSRGRVIRTSNVMYWGGETGLGLRRGGGWPGRGRSCNCMVGGGGGQGLNGKVPAGEQHLSRVLG